MWLSYALEHSHDINVSDMTLNSGFGYIKVQ